MDSLGCGTAQNTPSFHLAREITLNGPGLIDPDFAADLIDAAGGAGFPARILGLAHDLAGIEEIFAYQVEATGAPKALVSSSDIEHVAARAAWYARRFHHIDPANIARQQALPGTGFVKRVPIEEILQPDYRRICFERPRFNEKLCYGWRGGARSFVVSFYSRAPIPHGVAALDALAQIVLTGLARDRRPRDAEALVDVFERRLSSLYPALTSREREVTARTLAGATARDIAGQLGVSSGTVLTYRQRTYQKLGVSKASDLLASMTH